MKRYLACDCGYVATSDDLDDLIVRARAHARQAHGIELSDEQILWLSRPLAETPAGPEGTLQ